MKSHPGIKSKTQSPSFSVELAETICAEVAAGETLPRIAASHNLKLTTLYQWLNRYPDFADLYRQSIRWRAQTRYDKMDDVIRDVTTGVMPPIVGKTVGDMMKWQCSKDDNERYGDKITQEHTGKDGQMLEFVTKMITELPPSKDVKVLE